MFCGCIDIAQNIVIKKDGSGIVELTCIIPERTITQMKTMQKLKKEMIRASSSAVLAKEQTGPVVGKKDTGEDEVVSRHFSLLFDPAEERIRKELKQYEKDGIFIESILIFVRNARRIVKINLRFKDLVMAAESDLFRAHWPFTLSRTAKGNYQFRGRTGMGEKSSPSSSVNPETSKTLTSIFSNFKAVLKVSVPGKIIRTNASRKSDYSGAWIYDFNKNQNAFSAFRNCRMNILFTGRNLDLPKVMESKAGHQN